MLRRDGIECIRTQERVETCTRRPNHKSINSIFRRQTPSHRYYQDRQIHMNHRNVHSCSHPDVSTNLGATRTAIGSAVHLQHRRNKSGTQQHVVHEGGLLMTRRIQQLHEDGLRTPITQLNLCLVHANRSTE